MGLLLHQQLVTDRTIVTPITTEIAQGMIDRDPQALQMESRLRFPNPFQVPPMMDDFLPAVVQRLRYQPGDVGWWGWLFFDKKTREVAVLRTKLEASVSPFRSTRRSRIRATPKRPQRLLLIGFFRKKA